MVATLSLAGFLLLLTPALLASGQSDTDLPSPVLREVQIVDFDLRVQWEDWQPMESCAWGTYQLAYQEGCESIGNATVNPNATVVSLCSFPCFEFGNDSAIVSLAELEVESTKSYSLFLQAQCALQGDANTENSEEEAILTNFSAPLCLNIPGNYSRIVTSTVPLFEILLSTLCLVCMMLFLPGQLHHAVNQHTLL